MSYQENDEKINAFERLWREQFSTYPPLDKMTHEEVEKFKDYTRQVYTMGKEGKRSFCHW
jgi:hypothetical protein